MGSGIRITMNACQRSGQLRLRTRSQQGTDSFDRSHAHLRRAAAGKKAIDHFLPNTVVVFGSPDSLKFIEPVCDLSAALFVLGLDLFNCDRLFLLLHSVNFLSLCPEKSGVNEFPGTKNRFIPLR